MCLECKSIVTCLVANICFSAQYIARMRNSIVDVLSRFQEERFQTLAPQCKSTTACLPCRPVDTWQQLIVQGILGSLIPSTSQAFECTVSSILCWYFQCLAGFWGFDSTISGTHEGTQACLKDHEYSFANHFILLQALSFSDPWCSFLAQHAVES